MTYSLKWEGIFITEELKPCPFCNNPVFVDITDEEGNYPKHPEYEQDPYSGLCYVLVHPYNEVDICPIGCNEGEYMGVIYDTREEAVAAWNRRAEPDQLPEWALNQINNLRNIVMGSNFRDLKFDLCSDSETFRAVQAGIYKYLTLAMTLRREDGE